MDLGLQDRVALVLGAGGGLGGAVAAALQDEGALIAPCDLAVDRVPADLTRSCPPVPVDLRDTDAAVAAVDTVEQRLGPVEILVSVTGGPPPSGAAGVSADTWTEHFRSMVISVIALTDRVLPGMRAAGWGRIVTSTSSGVLSPIPMLGISNTVRSSLHTWAKTLAAEIGPNGITVNTVVPGRIATKRIAELDQAKADRTGLSVDQVEQQSIDTIPVGRYGRLEEFGSTVGFLCSEQASYITGSVVRVDGGMIPVA